MVKADLLIGLVGLALVWLLALRNCRLTTRAIQIICHSNEEREAVDRAAVLVREPVRRRLAVRVGGPSEQTSRQTLERYPPATSRFGRGLSSPDRAARTELPEASRKSFCACLAAYQRARAKTDR